MDTVTSAPQAPTAPKVRWWRRGRVVVPLAALVLGLLVVAALLFQPWKLFVNQVVDEASPVQGVTPTGPTQESKQNEPSRTTPAVVARGDFISQEHETSGTATIIELPDGSNVLRLENLSTSNGPELEVWLADAPVGGGNDGWFVFDDGKYESLGPLKGNIGNQNYPIPDSVDVADFTAVSIWCARFRVSFGAAELRST